MFLLLVYINIVVVLSYIVLGYNYVHYSNSQINLVAPLAAVSRTLATTMTGLLFEIDSRLGWTNKLGVFVNTHTVCPIKLTAVHIE